MRRFARSTTATIFLLGLGAAARADVVAGKDFKINEASRKERKAKPVMSSQTELSPQQQAKPVVVTYRFSSGTTTTNIKFK